MGGLIRTDWGLVLRPWDRLTGGRPCALRVESTRAVRGRSLRLHAALCALAGFGGMAAPQPAAANSAAADYFMSRVARSADWTRVQSMFAERPDGPLHGSARAEYYLAPGSPRIDLPTLTDWLNANPTLPQAEQIAALAVKRGGTALPSLPMPQALYTQP
ncbi:hypothetical protein E4T56_gene12047, partial [Termitomyces sp. T112]